MDIKEILQYLPHRYPFLLVDRMLEIEPGVRARGLKNVTMNEPFFPGHFPHHLQDRRIIEPGSRQLFIDHPAASDCVILHQPAPRGGARGPSRSRCRICFNRAVFVMSTFSGVTTT